MNLSQVTSTRVRSREHLSCYKASLFFKILTNLPSVTMTSIVFTSDACNKTIVGTRVTHFMVEEVHVTAPMAVVKVISRGTIFTPKIVNTIFFAISVLALPFHY